MRRFAQTFFGRRGEAKHARRPCRRCSRRIGRTRVRAPARGSAARFPARTHPSGDARIFPSPPRRRFVGARRTRGMRVGGSGPAPGLGYAGNGDFRCLPTANARRRRGTGMAAKVGGAVPTHRQGDAAEVARYPGQDGGEPGGAATRRVRQPSTARSKEVGRRARRQKKEREPRKDGDRLPFPAPRCG